MPSWVSWPDVVEGYVYTKRFLLLPTTVFDYVCAIHTSYAYMTEKKSRDGRWEKTLGASLSD